MGVARRYDMAFDAPEMGLLEAVTAATAHALQRFWLGSEREENANRQGALARAAKALAQSLDPARVLDTLCAEVARATGGDVVAVYFGDATDGLERGRRTACPTPSSACAGAGRGPRGPRGDHRHGPDLERLPAGAPRVRRPPRR